MGTELRSVSRSPRSLPAIDATYKSREVEGIVDLFFYRRIGFRLARFFARVNFTPAAVTLVGGVVGIVAGHLYFYRALVVNLLGMLFQVVANIFDNADGQLARLTNQQSRIGRILDPIVDHIIWFSIYLHLALRLQFEGFPRAIWAVAVAAGLSHAAQAAAADYWRSAYLYLGKGGPELDSASNLNREYRRYTWRANAWPKFLLGLYLNVTREQELLLPGVRQLDERIDDNFAGQIPAWFQSRYGDLVLPTLKWWGLLMTNTRMLVLFVVFLFRQPVWYFWFEITAANFLLIYLVRKQEKISRSLLGLLTTQKQSA